MNFKLELVQVPVTDVDAAIDFYVNKAGFTLDHDHHVADDLRFVQITPPGSACSIALGVGMSKMTPGSVEGLQVVVDSAEEARGRAGGRRRRGVRGPGVPVGPVRVLLRPRRERLGRAADRHPVVARRGYSGPGEPSSDEGSNSLRSTMTSQLPESSRRIASTP